VREVAAIASIRPPYLSWPTWLTVTPPSLSSRARKSRAASALLRSSAQRAFS
jgi:hypothetical protein